MPVNFSPVKNTLGNWSKKIVNASKGSFIGKTKQVLEMDGINIGKYPFITLITCFTLGPRLLNARDNDERKEILTRDVATIATLLFAMKPLNALLSNIASKKTGLILNNGESQAKNFFGKLVDYVKPLGGTSAMEKAELVGRYGNIESKEVLAKTLDFIEKQGGNVKKALTLDGEKGALTTASKSLLGNTFDSTSEAIINRIKTAGDEEIKPLLEVLNSKENPMLKKAVKVNTLLTALTYAILIGFLGFGLPAINKVLTDRRHKKQEANNAERRKHYPKKEQSVIPIAPAPASKVNKTEEVQGSKVKLEA